MEITLRVVDFFCGGGGFSEGFRQAGFEVTVAVDKWQVAVLTHQKNHPSSDTIFGDVNKISLLDDVEFEKLIPDSEIIIGSPPCVDFSSSNRSGKGDKSLGIVLIESYLRIVARKKFKNGSKLKYWILENVPNSQKYIKEEYSAKDLGLEGDFTLKTKNESSHVYNVQHYGAPSKRLRFICGDFPEPKKVIKSDADFIKLRYILNHLGKPDALSNEMISDPNYEFEITASQITDHYYVQEYAKFEWEQAKRLKEDKGYMGKMSFPENLDKPSRTIMATLSSSARESMILPYKEGRYRAATIREVACLMSFPLDYQFYGNSVGTKYRLVGNAVPPRLAFALAKAIAVKENLSVPKGYLRLNTNINDAEFVNLNGTVIPIKKEKVKRETARFKYHIPYLIIDAYRVELTNYWSDFESHQFSWDVEIHKSQGQSARKHTPVIPTNFLDKQQEKKISQFIAFYKDKLESANEFQKIYCLPANSRSQQKLIGPYELLTAVRNFLNELEDINDDKIEAHDKKQKLQLPVKIAVGYTVLKSIIDKFKKE